MSIEDLYEQDYYAWTKAQAQALRARGAGGNALDYDRLAGELEDLGSEQLHACEGWITQILAHFLKITHSTSEGPQKGWRREIVTFRVSLKRRLTATLRANLEAELSELYADAVKLARAAFAEDEPATALDFPVDCPFTFAEVLGGDDSEWFPESRA
jgi:hypothetical protein